MKNILDPSFKYTNSASTDISKTFKRIRAEMKSHQVKNQREPLVASDTPTIKTLADFEEVLGAR